MEIYLDNSATTRVCREAADKMTDMLMNNYGNPSSLHKKGIEASMALEKARGNLADALSCSKDEIYFTSSGTTANNTAIFGAVSANKRRGNRIVTTSLEHPSVNEAMKRLEQQGFEVIRLRPDSKGAFSPMELMNVINKKTILVSVMAVNNEIGTINPINQLKTAVKRVDSPALIHVDAVQAFGKIPLSPSRMGIDLMTVSSHKIHGPKGAGALYVKKGVQIQPHVVGGGQEHGIFSGTEAMPAIIGFGEAVRVLPDINREYESVKRIRDGFIKEVTKIGGVHINSAPDSLPYIINMSVLGVPSQTMVNALSEKGIYVSAGSACKKGHRSEVLSAIGLDAKFIDSAIRISLSRYNTADDMHYLATAVDSIVRRVRR